MTHRILLAGFYHETHTFVDETSGLEAFDRRVDEEVLSSKGDGSPMSGVIECAEEYNWSLVPAVDYRGGASGIVEDEVLEAYWQLLQPRLVSALETGIDAIFLVLHGAMTTKSHFDGEGELLERIRLTPGAEDIPIFGVYDLHANFTKRMAKYANCLVAYRENPHVDARASAVRAAGLLQQMLQGGKVPRMEMIHPPIVWPPTGVGTADEPMRTLEEMARNFEVEHEGIWALNVNAGFAFADVPEAGVSFSAVSTDGEVAGKALQKLVSKAVDLKELGNVVDEPVDSVLAGLKPDPAGPILLVEPSDNIGGGAPGDGTGVLRALLRHKIENAGVIIADAEAVQRLQGAALGSSAELSLGGKGSRLDPGPVHLQVRLESLSDGRFELEDLNSHLAAMRGRHIDMGPTAVVSHQGVIILLTSKKTPPFDLGQWRSQGVEPENFRFIGVKAAVAHRRAYDRIAAQSYTVGTDGPCASDLRKLPFRNISRPIYPLDNSTEEFYDKTAADA
ncbi:MAG: M81 family metallopeptidase [Trueperaceae bacterium]